MPTDSISPIAPARTKVLLLPVGRITRSRYRSFVKRLQAETLVRLGDVTPDPHPEKGSFSPAAFPNGYIIYDLTTVIPLDTHRRLSPFETFREPLLILCLADGREYQVTDEDGSDDQRKWIGVGDDLQAVRNGYPRALAVELAVFDWPDAARAAMPLKFAKTVPPPEQSKTTTIKTLLCDISAVLLAEFSTFAKWIQSLDVAETPSPHPKPLPLSRISADIFRGSSSQDRSTSRPSTPVTNSELGVRPMSQQSQSPLPSIAQSVSRPSSAAGGSFTPPANGSRSDLHRESVASLTSPSSIRLSMAPTLDRRSTVGSKTANANVERGKSRLKARQSLIIGSLYLHAGRWPDALRELVDATTRARAFSDHAWHAKGLELILATLLMLAWAGIDFQIPSICYPVLDKASTNRNTLLSNAGSITEFRTSTETSHSRAMDNMNISLPDVCHMIATAYFRATTSEEPLAQLAFCQGMTRLAKLLAVFVLLDCKLNDDALQYFVLGRTLPKMKQAVTSPLARATKQEVAHLIFQAFPSKDSEISVTDNILVIADMASVLALVGLRRKEAILWKELFHILIPLLIQARKVGAAEVGIHPAAGLAVLQGFRMNTLASDDPGHDILDIRTGFRQAVKEYCETFGLEWTTDKQSSDSYVENDGLSRRQWGGQALKKEVLRLCANIFEALPDFDGVTEVSSLLLRLAGPEMPLFHTRKHGMVSLPREEQIRLVSKVKRNVKELGDREGVHVMAHYWDDFLVRNVQARLVSGKAKMVQRPASHFKHLSASSTELETVQDGPFLYSALKANENVKPAIDVLVVGEHIDFVVDLQNPYDFELHIESMSLLVEGAELQQTARSVILESGIHGVFLSATAVSSGSLEVRGCKVKIQGCYEKDFPIYKESWIPPVDGSLKAVKLNAQNRDGIRNGDKSGNQSEVENASPKLSCVKFTVLPAQPLLEVKYTSLSQSILDIVEGETKSFIVTIENTSSSVVADLFHVSFLPSRLAANNDTQPLQTAASLAGIDSEISWQRDSTHPSDPLSAQSSTSLVVKVVGDTSLIGIVMMIDYAKLPDAEMSKQDNIFTRQIVLPFGVTVSPGIQLQRADVMALSKALFVGEPSDPDQEDELFALLLDLRNSWSSPLKVLIEAVLDKARNMSKAEPRHGSVMIQPGSVARVVLQLPLLQIHDFDGSAPWCKTVLLDRINGSWHDPLSSRNGQLDLQNISLSTRMVKTMVAEAIRVRISINEENPTIQRFERNGHGEYTAAKEQFLTLTIHVQNNTSHLVRPFLDISATPGKPENPRTTAHPAEGIMLTGTPHRRLALLEPGKSQTTRETIGLLTAGCYEVGAAVEAVPVAPSKTNGEAEGKAGGASGGALVGQGLARRGGVGGRAGVGAGASRIHGHAHCILEVLEYN